MKSIILHAHEAAQLAEAGRVTIWRPVLLKWKQHREIKGARQIDFAYWQFRASWIMGTPSPYVPGETRWCKEAWGAMDLDTGYGIREFLCPPNELDENDRKGIELAYRAGASDLEESIITTWFPARSMPRWASRCTARVASIGVKRCQALMADDADAMGLTEKAMAWIDRRYRRLGGWDANLWGWFTQWELLEGSHHDH
jgi:hypothetical protein